MIPDTSGAIAIFADKHSIRTRKKIIAWSDDGQALVFSDKFKHLTRAHHIPGFVGIETPGEHPDLQVATAIPAPGWNIEWPTTETDDKPFIKPLIGWGVMRDGSVLPLDTDSTGNVEPVDCLHEVRIFHDSESA